MEHINAALSLHKPILPDELTHLKKLAEGKGIALNLVPALSSHQMFDVSVVHEKTLSNGTAPSGTKNLILLFDNSAPVEEVFKKAKHLHAAGVLGVPFDHSALLRSIQEVYQDGFRKKPEFAVEKAGGRTIAISSFKAGVGKSIIAYNLASALAAYVEPTSVSLVDLNRPMPAARALIDMDPEVGWNTIKPLLADGQLVDQTKLASVSRTTAYGFRLFSQGGVEQKENHLSASQLKVLAASLCSQYSLTIFDMPATASLSECTDLEIFDSVIFVATPEAQCIANLTTALPYLNKYHEELFKKSVFVLNRFEKKHEKMQKSLEERLGLQIFGAVIDDAEAVEAFTSRGRLFDDKSLIITRDLAALAGSLFKKVF